ncbi:MULTISPECIES: PilN family type IVB pilus formation outer membrane protein [Yersinia]|uniref:PilN family type IVB pilus formation outer membrane protein n=1 Tax=Yersinia TaxID=629 RepID=UPI0011A8EB71|nr:MULTISPECIES: PilN family type IVB pilus formation outer membrane protein [Yersinia]MBS0057709.1 PilN family type IVB pilus formation outer membrane protein [Yersinia sp. Marseille-Q3913]
MLLFSRAKLAPICACLLLTGCPSLDRINTQISDTEKTQKIVSGQIEDMRKGHVVKELTSQWINPTPITGKGSEKSQLPSCAPIFSRAGDVSLAEIGAFISTTCHIPLFITPDAQGVGISGGTTTQAMSGAIPPPDPTTGMVPLAQLGSTSAPSTTPVTTTNTILRGVFWQGGLEGLLDNITTRLGLSWRYEQGKITIFYIDTRTFPVNFMDNMTVFSSTTVSGTTTSNGSSGGTTSTGGISGDNNTSQSTETKIKTSLYEDIKTTVAAMLTPKVGRMNLSAGMLTVSDTPQVLEAVGRYIADRNKQLNRQVVFNVQVYSVEARNQENLGFDLAGVFNSGSVKGMLTGSFANVADNAMSGGVTLLDGKGKGSEAFIRALSEKTNTSIVTQASAMTTNMSPVPLQMALQQDFVAGITTAQTANVGSSTDIQRATITTGFNMVAMPYMMPDSDQMQLQFSISISDDPTFRTVKQGDAQSELSRTHLKTSTYRVILRSGNTMLLTAFDQGNNTASKQGVGSTSFWGLGGGGNAEKNRNMLLILVTANIVG